jgi:hypothetical protein
MPLTASSAGAIIYSVLLTKFAVTGHYLVDPGILRNLISTHQSTWMEMALEDGGGTVVALGGGVEKWCWAAIEDAVAALGGRSTAEKHAMMALASAL